MISPSEARILDECFIRYENPPEHTPPEKPLQREFLKSHILECIEEKDIHEDYLHNLEADSLIEIFEVQYCTRCDLPSEICTYSDHQYDLIDRYQLAPEPIIQAWMSWVNLDSLEIYEHSRLTAEHWELSCQFDNEEIVLHAFFSDSAIREFDFQPEQFEFGISFVDHRYIPSEGYIFSWFEPLIETQGNRGQEFENNLRNIIEEYQDAISARFVSEADVQGFRREMRRGIREYLESRGYDSHREISRHATGYSKYEIEPEGDDFVATKEEDGNDIAIFVCHCSKGRGSYHLHRFENGKITSTEEREEFSHLLNEIEDKIDRFKDLKNRQKLTGKAITVLGAIFSVINVILVADIFINANQLLKEVLPADFVNSDLGIGLFVGNFVIALLLFLVLISPYIQQYRFNWSIDSGNL